MHSLPTLAIPFARTAVHALAIGTLLWVSGAMAQSGPPPDGKGGGPGMGRPHGPPPEAIAACTSKAIGAACSFAGRSNEAMAGSCAAAPSAPPGVPTGMPPGSANTQPSSVIACRPANMPAPPAMGK